jgi:Leucine-rich repeat (LRR) protein
MITTLQLSGQGIRSLDGIEQFTSLRQLTLNGLRNVDLTPLESLTGVRRSSCRQQALRFY